MFPDFVKSVIKSELSVGLCERSVSKCQKRATDPIEL